MVSGKPIPAPLTILDLILKTRGIILHNAAGYAVHAVSELAIGLMIALLRRIVTADAAIRAGADTIGLQVAAGRFTLGRQAVKHRLGARGRKLNGERQRRRRPPQVAALVLGNCRADLGDTPDNLMAGDHSGRPLA
jgi:lactate dehydrogenase-like 2-hydroxyacid dehydrogenase